MYETQIQKWGNSQAIRIPKAIIELAAFRLEETLELSVDDGKIIISKINKKHRTLDERFADYNGNYLCNEWDTGEDIGEEKLNV